MKKILVNMFLTSVSFTVLFLFLEFVLFRFVLIAPDMPNLTFVDGIVKYEPHQRGVYRVRNEIRTVYKINANGWNSKYDQYKIEKHPTKVRIAIIGDSYVQAFQVDYDKSVAEQLEQLLGHKHYEVYRFGIGGAPLSQYLHMLRKEVLKYRPDLVVVILAHNDFTESFLHKPGVYTSSFLKLKIHDDAVSEIKPIAYQRIWYSHLRELATWRYLVYRQKVSFQPIRDVILGRAERKEKRYQANVEMSTVNKSQAYIGIVTNYVFGEIKEICDDHGIEFLIVIDGQRHEIYKQTNSNRLYESGALRLNKIAHQVAQDMDLHFIDLHPVFENDYTKNKKLFNFESNGHWNVYGHSLVAHSIFQYIEHQMGLLEDHFGYSTDMNDASVF